LVGEVFAKILRRKDLAGKSEEKDAEKDKGKKASKKTKSESEDDEKRASNGKINNLISVDTMRVSEVCAYLHFFWPEGALTLIIATYLLFQVLGLSALAGLGVMALMIPINVGLSKLFYVYSNKILEASDVRLNLATEVIGSMKIVKVSPQFSIVKLSNIIDSFTMFSFSTGKTSFSREWRPPDPTNWLLFAFDASLMRSTVLFSSVPQSTLLWQHLCLEPKYFINH
jgi:hypothetical protein